MGDKENTSDKGQSATAESSTSPATQQPIDERFGFVMRAPTKPKTQWEKTKLFLYNKRHKTVLGRTAWSWIHIAIFYMVYFPVIFTFFAMSVVISYQFMSSDAPFLVGTDSLLNFSPGLGFRPTQQGNPESSLIWYNKNDHEDVNFYVSQLTKIVEEEGKSKLKGIDCKDSSTRPRDGEFCKVYGGLDWGPCTKENQFGYADGTPCVLIRLNKILFWVPKMEIPKGPKYMDSILKNSGNVDIKGHVWIECMGETPLDQELSGEINVYPTNRPKPGVSTLPPNYFPYKTHKGYLSPFIMIQFSGPTVGALIKIRCYAHNGHVKINTRDGLGTAEIELLVDQ